jgi:hypothetical protein
MNRRLVIIAALLLVALAEPSTAPAQTLPSERPSYDIVLSAAPPALGTVIELDLPAGRHHEGVQLLQVPGQPHRMKP